MSHPRRTAPLLTLTTALVTALATAVGLAPPAVADDRHDSLPQVRSGHRPGPDALYAAPPRAPQLENTGPWQARPILVSGAESYRAGEWVYQDFLYDDHGATGVPDPEAPYGPDAHLFSPSGGTFTYPTDPVFAHNAADIVELRTRPLAGATAFRVTLNTLKDPARTAFTIALGDGENRAWPHAAGVSSPAQLFLTWHGETVELLDAETGQPVLPQPTVRVDTLRRQVDVRIPHEAWNPRRNTVRTTVGAGLWDIEAGSYVVPEPGAASETTAGGGAPNGVGIVNVGPRFDEPLPFAAGVTIADTAVGAAATAPWWRERQQSLQLTQGDVTPFASEVDYGKLRDRVRDNSGVPRRGTLNRILASRHVFGQGLDLSKDCFDITSGEDPAPTCQGRFVGQLQPYSLYVPKGQVPRQGWGTTLLLHSLSANYNQYSATRNQTQLGDRGAGSVVLTPAGRGPDGFYQGIAEADTFETWADVARRYRLDPGLTSVSGYSMGGFGTFRMLARWPDLFARGFSVVGIPGTALDQLASLRHTPVLSWGAAGDELVNLADQREMVDALTAVGVRFGHWTFPGADHLTLAANDEYGAGADFLGSHRAVRNPARVTYVVDPREDSATGRVVADHAYWLSGLRVRDDAGPGTIDVRSLATRRGSRKVLPVEQGAGVLTGGQNQAMPYTTETRPWGAAPVREPRNALRINAQNVRRVVIDPARAGVTCGARLLVRTDGPLTVVLAGCRRTESFSG
ncbi:MAG: hypothetical protein ACRDOM_04915 [Nocardioides sp.]